MPFSLLSIYRLQTLTLQEIARTALFARRVKVFANRFSRLRRWLLSVVLGHRAMKAMLTAQWDTVEVQVLLQYEAENVG
jgi:hypothetical protein